METPPPTVEQRHRHAAARIARIFEGNDSTLPDHLAQGILSRHWLLDELARFDTERTAELERENAALDGALWDVIKAWDNASGMSAAIARARNALGGQPS